MKAQIDKSQAPVLALIAFLFCCTVARQILVRVGSTNTIIKNNFPTAITNTFAVTHGARVLVVSTYVQNNLASD